MQLFSTKFLTMFKLKLHQRYIQEIIWNQWTYFEKKILQKYWVSLSFASICRPDPYYHPTLARCKLMQKFFDLILCMRSKNFLTGNVCHIIHSNLSQFCSRLLKSISFMSMRARLMWFVEGTQWSKSLFLKRFKLLPFK